MALHSFRLGGVSPAACSAASVSNAARKPPKISAALMRFKSEVTSRKPRPSLAPFARTHAHARARPELPQRPLAGIRRHPSYFSQSSPIISSFVWIQPVKAAVCLAASRAERRRRQRLSKDSHWLKINPPPPSSCFQGSRVN